MTEHHANPHRRRQDRHAAGLPLTIFRLDIRLVDPDRQAKHEITAAEIKT
jgi:hypothetical protein